MSEINPCGQCGEFALASRVIRGRHEMGGYIVTCFNGDCGNQAEERALEENAIKLWNECNPLGKPEALSNNKGESK